MKSPLQNPPDSKIPSVDLNAPLKIEEAPIEVHNEPTEESNKTLFGVGIVIFILIVCVVFGIGILASKVIIEQKKEVSTSEVAQTPVPSAVTDFNRGEINFEILNGSGVAGAAKLAAEKVTSLGYKVANSGNADKQDYEGNILLISKDIKNNESQIIADLKKDFNIRSAQELTESSASAQLILGK